MDECGIMQRSRVKVQHAVPEMSVCIGRVCGPVSGVGGQPGGVGPEQGVEHSDCRVEETVFAPAGFGPGTLQSPP